MKQKKVTYVVVNLFIPAPDRLLFFIKNHSQYKCLNT